MMAPQPSHQTFTISRSHRRNSTIYRSLLLSLLNVFFYHCTLSNLLTIPVSVESLAATKSKGKSAIKGGGGGSSAGTGFGASSKAPTFIHTPDKTQETQRLLAFLQSQNAKGLNKCEVGTHQQTGVRGLFTLQNIKKGQLIFQIPSDCALALSDPNRQGEDCPTIAHYGANLMGMYMKVESQRQFWSPYLDTLPTFSTIDRDGKRTSFDPTPDFMCDDDLNLLEFPRVVQKAKERQTHIEQVATEKDLDQSELQFATWLVSSRSFTISLSGPAADSSSAATAETDKSNNSSGNDEDYTMPKHDERGQVISKSQQKQIKVLVPYLDMVNHSSDQSNCKLTLIDPEKDDAWFALEATRPISAGKELTISYGNGVESSAELLLDYGFVPSTNRIDSMMLKKGGDDCITSLDGWTTTLEEDRTMLTMTEDDPVLQKILQFRIRLKESYDS